MARQLRVEIDGDSKGGRKALDDVADESDKAAATLRGLAAEMKAAARDGQRLEGELKDVGGQAKDVGGSFHGMSREVDKAAEQLREAARASAKLDASLVTTRAEIARLNKEFGETGDVKVLDAIQKQYAEFDRISRIKKRIQQDDAAAAATAVKAVVTEHDRLLEIEKQFAQQDRIAKIKKRIAKEDESTLKRAAAHAKAADHERKIQHDRSLPLLRRLALGAMGAGQNAAGALGGIGSELTDSPWKLGVGAAAAVPAAIFGGAAIGGATLFGGAAAGAGLGLLGAAMGNPEKYGAMWDDTISRLKDRWIAETSDFGGPLTDSINEVGRVISDLPLDRLAKASKGFIDPLVQGAGGLLTNLADGFADLLDKAQPVADKMGPKLANLGNDVGDSLRAIGEGSEGGAAALGDLTTALGWAIKAAAVFIMGLERTYLSIRKFESANKDFIDSVPVVGTFVDGMVDSLFRIDNTSIVAARSLHGVSDAESAVAISAEEAAAKVKSLNEAFDESVNKALDSVSANVEFEKAQDALTEGFKRGKDALDASTKKGQENIDLALAYVKAADQQRQAAIDAGDGSALASAKANEAYRKQIGGLEDILVKLGLSRDAAHAFAEQFMGLDGMTVTTNIVTRHIDQYLPSGVSLGNLLHHARGGTVAESGFSVVGEHGAETRFLNRGEYLATAEQTRALTSMMSGASGGSARPTAITVMPGVGAGADPLSQLVLQSIQSGRVQLFAGGQQVTTRP